MITFVTKYDDHYSKFGGMVRVKDIENSLRNNVNCQFLELDFKSPFKDESYINRHGNQCYRIGFLKFSRVRKVLNLSTSIYYHTVGNYIKVSNYNQSNVPRYIDLHGSQPEEFSYSGNRIKSKIWAFFEKIAFIQCDGFIYVSNNMKSHFQSKYKFLLNGKKEYTVPIFPSELKMETVGENLEILKKSSRNKLKLPLDKKIIIYSGGAQAWQKKELLKDYIKANYLNEDFLFIILSNQEDVFQRLISDIPQDNIIIKSVVPSALYDYYLASDYGVMFRDDNILNKVSSPTKLSEYLFYGLIPIMLSKNVGDFVNEGIDYVEVDSDLESLNTIKSEKNRQIIINKISNSEKSKLMADLINDF